MYGLHDKVAFITGGSSGIGKATALVLAREGVKVTICSIQDQEGEELAHTICSKGGAARYVRADVRQAEEIQAAVEKTVSTYGRLDIAFNNAGINGDIAPLHLYTEESWDTLISINLKGIWLSMKYEIPHMLEKGGGYRKQLLSVRVGQLSFGYCTVHRQ